MRRFLRKLFKKHYKKVQIVERVVQYGHDIKWFFRNYRRVFVEAGLEQDIDKLEKTGDKLLEDIKDLLKVY